ncbi:hypothetical protein DFH07DRAFT_946415 [Mycena maculata]|uniref:MFS general substrate transporter n=1 Tax=Mycena maculata TaxID=230809 RepID=A0AAD7MMA6_9AGAR|nr:hypothetical protein DFH07DRAFT_946415 [Mycena maculata]
MRAPTESSPLLADQLETQQAAKKPDPLPRAQLAALCISRMTDPVAYSQIFPYINEFLILLPVTDDISKIGFYSGLVESTLAIFQMLTSIHRLLFFHSSRGLDLVGRRPIILLGGLGLAVVILLLGFCTSLSQIIIRIAYGFQAGCLAGNTAVYLAVLTEITDPSNQAVAYPLYAFGRLARPLPESFGYDILLAYPYFMPNFACALLVILGFVMAYLFLEEPPDSRWDSSAPHKTSSSSSSATPPSNAMTEIGYALALSGILVVFQLLLMPTLLNRYDAAKMYNTSMRFWPLTFVLTPLLHLIVREGYDAERGLVDPMAAAVLWVGIAVVLADVLPDRRLGLCACVPSAFVSTSLAHARTSTNIIIMRNHSPGSNSFGAANGLVQVAMPSQHIKCMFEHGLPFGYVWVLVIATFSLPNYVVTANASPSEGLQMQIRALGWNTLVIPLPRFNRQLPAFEKFNDKIDLQMNQGTLLLGQVESLHRIKSQIRKRFTKFDFDYHTRLHSVKLD